MATAKNNEWVAKLVQENYGVEVYGTPILLHQRDEQRVFKVNLKDGDTITLRLCPSDRSRDRVLADTGALLFLEAVDFPAPRLHSLPDGSRTFEWQQDSWAYATEFLEGVNPEPPLDLTLLQELAFLLAKLHNIISNPNDYPIAVAWLADLPNAIARAEGASSDAKWGQLAKEVADNLKSLPDLAGLPLGFIHTDVHEGNMLVSPDNELYMLDWEDAGLGEPLFDVCLVLAWNCVWKAETANLLFSGQPDLYDFDEEYCRNFLGAYQSIRPLSDREAEMIGPSIRFLMGWFAARDIEREVAEPGVSEGLAFTSWAIMRSVTPEWAETLRQWAIEMRQPAAENDESQ